MSLNLLSTMSAAEEPYDPHNPGYADFRFGTPPMIAKHRNPWSRRQQRTGVKEWTPEPRAREEEEQNAYERRRIYEDEQGKTRVHEAKTKANPPKSDVAGASVKNNSFQDDVSSVCVNYVL